MIVVDSSVWVDHFRGIPTPKREVLEQLLRAGSDIAITDVINMELLRGVKTDADVDALRSLLLQTQILQMRSLAGFELAADLFRRVRRDGHTVRQSTDCMIAATCIAEDVPLLHDDVDFDLIARVSTLRVM